MESQIPWIKLPKGACGLRGSILEANHAASLFLHLVLDQIPYIFIFYVVYFCEHLLFFSDPMLLEYSRVWSYFSFILYHFLPSIVLQIMMVSKKRNNFMVQEDHTIPSNGNCQRWESEPWCIVSKLLQCLENGTLGSHGR